jgi:hypothetical protein
MGRTRRIGRNHPAGDPNPLSPFKATSGLPFMVQRDGFAIVALKYFELAAVVSASSANFADRLHRRCIANLASRPKPRCVTAVAVCVLSMGGVALPKVTNVVVCA